MADAQRVEPVCHEKARLTRTYAVATSDYGRAVQVLNSYLGVLQQEQYKQIRAAAELARTTAEKARQALHQHTDEHGC
jgi:ABC-type transporter Mla subunit MlaD